MLTAVHLLFSTGHTAGEGDALVREELCDRALHLARILAALLPEQAETRGLLGLLLLTDARRVIRTDEQGQLLLLADQDWTRWDQRAILEGLTVTAGRWRPARRGASPCRRRSPACTRWRRPRNQWQAAEQASAQPRR